MEEKSEFKQKLDTQLNELETQVDKLKAKAKEATEEAKVKYNELIDELEPTRRTARPRTNRSRT